MKDIYSVLKKVILLCFLLTIFMVVLQACKKKRCPDDLPPFLQNYTNNYSPGRVIVYKNQYNESITLPASLGITSKNIHNLPHTNECEIKCNISTEYNDSLYFSSQIWGHLNDNNYYNYTLNIGLGNSDIYKKYFDFFYIDDSHPGGYPATNSSDTTKYHDSYIINGITYSKVFQVILTDSSRGKLFFKQYFLNLENGFIRFDEKYSDKIWVLNS